MGNCKICGEECKWTFCSDCLKIIESGMPEMTAKIAKVESENIALTDRIAKLKTALRQAQSFIISNQHPFDSPEYSVGVDAYRKIYKVLADADKVEEKR